MQSQHCRWLQNNSNITEYYLVDLAHIFLLHLLTSRWRIHAVKEQNRFVHDQPRYNALLHWTMCKTMDRLLW